MPLQALVRSTAPPEPESPAEAVREQVQPRLLANNVVEGVAVDRTEVSKTPGPLVAHHRNMAYRPPETPELSVVAGACLSGRYTRSAARYGWGLRRATQSISSTYRR